MSDDQTPGRPTEQEWAEAIWNASRADEGTISAMGADVVARRLRPLIAREREAARAEGRERLRVAERVCALVGWTATRGDSDREKAATQAWMEWSASRPGMSDRDAWPDLDDDGIAALAQKRDEIRAATITRITRETPGATT